MDSSTNRGNNVILPASSMNFANGSFKPFRINHTTVKMKKTESQTIYDHLLYNDCEKESINFEESKSCGNPVSSEMVYPYQRFSKRLPPRAPFKKADKAGNKIGNEIRIATPKAIHRYVMNRFLSSFFIHKRPYPINTGKTVKREKHAMEKQV